MIGVKDALSIGRDDIQGNLIGGFSMSKLYKKVDRSTLEWGITIPKDLEDAFKSGIDMEMP